MVHAEMQYHNTIGMSGNRENVFHLISNYVGCKMNSTTQRSDVGLGQCDELHLLEIASFHT